MPVNTSAVVMRAQPGAELVCRAHNLPPTHPAQPRGILSYYATTALPEARSMEDWLAHSEALVQKDVDAGHLPPFYHPHLRLLGDGDRPPF